MSEDTVTLWRGAASLLWVEATASANHPATYGTAHNKDLSGPSINSVQAEKLSSSTDTSSFLPLNPSSRMNWI